MAANPNVCAACLTRDRPEMLKRAVACFEAQMYPKKHLLIWDTGLLDAHDYGGEFIIHAKPLTIVESRTIGELRNDAIAFIEDAEIIAHFDDDDWSHPNRIAEQVALLQASGADAVGYNEMLFWRTFTPGSHGGEHERVSSDARGSSPTGSNPEAWLYRNPDPRYAIGTSLCYWRETWKRKPFSALPRKRGGMGEDHAWIQGLNVQSQSSVLTNPTAMKVFRNMSEDVEPRMIASIHGANTMPYDDLGRKDVTEWSRVTDWDEHCRKVMTL